MIGLRKQAREVLRVASAAKTIDNELLNTAGVQVARTVVARALQRGRQWRRDGGTLGANLLRDGMVTIPNYLPKDRFAALLRETDRLASDRHHPRQMHCHGRASVVQTDLLSTKAKDCPEVWEFLGDPKWRRIVEAAEGRKIAPFSGHRVLEELRQGSEGVDRESELHVDTFFHNHKLWLYLSDVTMERGPLVYVRGSHRLTRRHLKESYRESVGRNRGSRRIGLDERMSAGTEEVLTCAANTLVIANTAGFHRRLPGEPGHVRRALQLSFRANPFLPNVGAGRAAGRLRRALRS